MTSSNHKNNIPSARTSAKKSEMKSASSRTNEKTTIEIKKSVLTRNI